MRTTDEIIKRIKTRGARSFFGFEVPHYILALAFKDANPWLKKTAKAEDWDGPLTDEQVKERAVDYMPFAWEKANGFRGISASRSISRYIAWMWLLGHDNTERWENYSFYGKPQLREICGLLGLDADKWDDSVRLNNEPY
jgi:hypothetical protein